VLIWSGIGGLCAIVMRLLYRVRRAGGEHVPASGPAIFVANHQSHYDPVIVGVLVKDRPFASMARASLFRFKPFGAFIRLFGALPIERGRGDAGALRALIGELQAGRCVLLFPEGSRTTDGTTRPFQRGAILLARRGHAPIVPVAIEGAFRVWPRGRSFPRLWGRIGVMAGAALTPERLEELGEEAALEELRRVIDGMREAMKKSSARR
jgi:1-acyl-sn-glycerol-3-phosphate acyltransferase